MSTEKGGELSPLKKALLAVQQLKARVQQLESGPVAIVGAGLRLPGGVRDLDGYWRLLSEGVDAVREVPPDRWDAEAWAPETGTTEAGFLDDVATFDAPFFGISPREALEMDPAQRLLLEVAWEALENAAIAPDRLERSATGVYVGLGLSDYARRHFLGPDPTRMSAYSGTGSFLSVAAGRISYTLGLQGPAMTVDTACSSSLVSIHLAVEALRRKEIDLALAGGANLLLAPEPTAYFTKLGALALDGRCKTFDARADGYGRGEGAAIVALKRLEDAVADGDPILAVIRGTAVNQDGRSNGLTAPSGAAQQAVIRAALDNAGLTIEQVGLIEAHGTGTPLGDPIEVEAVQAVFAGRSAPIRIGAVKSNFGHLETAAGVAGLLKVALAAQRGAVPPHLHLTELNPRIRPDGISIPTVLVPWTDAERIGGVSSFGLSGTNAHILVSSAPGSDEEPTGTVARPVEILTLSGRTPAQVRAVAARWAEALQDVPLAEAAHTSVVGRAALQHRTAIAARSTAEVVERLAALGRGDTDVPGVVSAQAAALSPAVAFLLTGQGAQHPGMGRALAETEPVFRAALEEIAAAFAPHLPCPLLDVMWGEDAELLNDTGWTQPALFTLEVALARWWEARGVVPDILLGHSIGELAAAHLAGTLDLPDAATLVAARGRLMSALPRTGTMVAIMAAESEVAARLEPGAEISGVNHPGETVISGETDAVGRVAAAFEEKGVRVRRLHVSHAFHSALMEPMLDVFEAVATSVTLRPGRIPVVSNIDGQLAGDRHRDPQYWRDHVRHAVRFADGIAAIVAGGTTLFLEIGPRPVLSAMGARVAPDAAFLPSLHPDRDDAEQVAETTGALWARGAAVDLASLHAIRDARGGRRAVLPPTPFLGERIWLDPPEAAAGAEPLADLVTEIRWRAAPVGRGAATGTWTVHGDVELAKALEERGATVAAGGEENVVLVAGNDGPAWLARTAAELALRAKRLFLVSRADRFETQVLRGVGKVVALERPDRWGGHVLLDGDDVDALADALVANDGERDVLVRDGERRVARLARSRRALVGEPVAVRGTWIVTGGFGALGLRVARWLSARGAERIVLVSRSGAKDAEAKRVLEDLGAVEEKVDLGDADAVNALVARTPGLKGIVHAAGTSEDAALDKLDPESFDRVIDGKLRGAVHLHEATAGLDLDAFVLFSSAAGTLGVPGQAAYAAANAGLDALAAHRRAMGLPAVSLAFGPWAGGGMAARVPAAIEASWKREGIVLLDPDEALATLGRTLGSLAPAVLVAPFDWTAWKASRRTPDPIADELASRAAPTAEPVAVEAATALVEALRTAPTGARHAMIADHVQQVVSRVLGHGPGKRIGVTEGFFDAGMDSLMAVDVRERLQAALGVGLSATVAFDHPTVERLADHLLTVLAFGKEQVARRAAGTTNEAVAIVGAACRLPGGATTLDALWDLLERGGDAITEVPRDRFDVDRYFDPTPGTPGKLYSRYGGFVDGIELFEPQLFGISPREAASLDPQQRLLLETAWHALEDAGIGPRSLGDTLTGVYTGIGQSEYWHRFDPTIDEVDAYAGTGNETSFAAGRVSYVLGLQGPSMSVNTACSSSLVAVHLAMRALREGQCDVALAGGVNAIVGPETTIWMSMLQALAPDGRCKAFDARADGYVRSEGAGMVVLKRLSDAERDGDRIYAVLRGSAINHDGASSGLTVPNGVAQQQVIGAALGDAGLVGADIDFVECHGTGTRLGDPIEVRALGSTYGQRRTTPLWLGAAKANFGHLEAGAGIVGLLRAMLAVHRGIVPPIALLTAPNPSLPLDEFPAIRLPTEAVPWENGDRPRRAAVSSFGISGTNAHVVLEQAPERAVPDRTTSRPLTLLTLSGRTDVQVVAQAGALASHLADRDVPLADVAYTLNTGRSGLAHRAALVVSDLTSARDALQMAAGGSLAIRGEAGDPPRIVFLCTGAGPQQVGMARALYDGDPVFRTALDDAAREVDPVLHRPILDAIYGADDGGLHDLSLTQPAMFAIEWAMAALWRSFGIEPAAVVGHSTGQYVAACLAGVFDLGTGIRLMARRAKLMSDEPRIGEMVACFAAEDRVRSYLEGYEDKVGIAAVNGPAETVLSGLRQPVTTIADRIEADGIEIRRLNISHAAHSPLMEPILDRFEQLVAETPMSRARIPLVENVRGAIAGDEVLTSAYWREHMRQGVRFYAGMRTLVDEGYRVFLEIGNHPVLAGAGGRCVDDIADVQFVPSLRRDRPDWEQLLESVGRLWTFGARVDWAGFHRHQPGAKIALPGLPFERKRHWVERKDRTASRVVGAEWTYAARWEPVRPNVDAFGARGAQPILILADEGGLGDAFAARQQRKTIVLRASEADRLETVLAEERPGSVVHLWSLDPDRDLAPAAAARPAVVSALRLIQGASRNGNPALFFITRGAQSIGNDIPDLFAAPLVGLLTTAAVELPDLPVVRLDLPSRAEMDTADDLLHVELLLNTGLVEDDLAVRDGRMFGRRLARVPADGAAAPAIRADAAYLVTGGQGAIGLRVAAWLAEQGAGAIVLNSRRAATAEARQAVERFADRVRFVQGDVGDAADVARMVEPATGLPIVGVFHAAGTIDDASLLTLEPERLDNVWRAKIDGAAQLDRALPDAELFVLFSSAASHIGSAGQGSYAAANAFLDALAAKRRAEGRHAVSLCWGPWADGGLAVDATKRAWERGGVRPLAPSQAIAVMAQRLGGPDPVVAVVDLDWKAWPRSLPRVPTLVRSLVEEDAPAAATKRTLKSILVAAPAAKRAELLADAVAAEVGAILGMAASEVDRKVGFFDAGMDSLMAVDLAKRLKQALESPLPATVAFDHPSIDAIVRHLLDTLDLGEAAAAPAPVVVAAAERRIDLDEPIAVIGISCRMPGGANDPEAFWELLRSGRDPIRPVPPERWDLSAYYDPRQGQLGKMYVREAGFVDQDLVEGFDPEFFSISPREAESMDPQQRMLLEVSYEALERAGVATAALRHSRTGVFVGVGDSGYLDRFQGPGDMRYADQYAGTGNLEAFVSGRVAYVLGLHGPNLALNTACSSSLVALHLACQSLRFGEAELALAGGVHLMLSPENFVYVSQIRAVSPDGRCKTFDASADGYGRAEGCGMVVLERLSVAQRKGDPVLAVIRATAIGHDGPSSGLTVPYGPAQVQVLSDAVGRAGIHPHDVSYLEAHGTGTVLGDPIEVHAAEEVYCQGRDPENPLHLGAVKAHVGHLEVAAGAASLVKMVLAIQHRQIPPHLHFHSPNPDLDLEGNALVIDRSLAPWAPPSGRLVAGISGFGLAGTNVHAIMEEPPAPPPRVEPGRLERGLHLLPISARSPEALRILAARYGDALDRGDTLADVAFSAATTRNAYEHRLAITAPDAAEVSKQLASYVTHGEAPQATVGQAAGRPPKVAFLFSGQGSQYPGMSRALYDTFPVYRDVVDRSAAVLDPLLPRALRDVLFGAGDERDQIPLALRDPIPLALVHDTTFTQPALFVVEVAMAALWKSWGVEPALVLGHSIGQIAAACVAGVFSLEDGLRLVAARGRLMGALPREGSMVAVFADEATVTEAIAPHRADIGIAGLNNPGETVISGRTAAVKAAAEALRAKGIETRDLVVSHAFHSPLMAPMLDAFEGEAKKVRYSAPSIPVVCNLTGAIAGDELSDPAYWRRLAESPVRFADGLRTVEANGIGVFLEVGPHTALLGMGRRTLTDRGHAWLPSLQRGEDELSRIVPSLGALWVRGVAVDWRGFDAPWARNRVQLPTHPFIRRRTWLDKPEFPQVRRQDEGWLVEVVWEEKPAAPEAPSGTWKVRGDAAYATELAERGARLGSGGSVLVVVAPGADPAKLSWQVLELARDLPDGARLALVGPDEAAFAAPIGLLRAARAERGIDAVTVVLEDELPVETVIDAVLTKDGEPEVRLRADRTRVVRRLDHTKTGGVMPELPGDGAVLVTGGLGGIGLAAARWLGEHGATHLVLTGRSAPSSETESEIGVLRGRGVDVVVDRGDVAQMADVDRILGAIRARGHRVVGIVHAAGVLADGALANQDEAGLRKVFAPKVSGSRHLAAATASDPLLFFVFFAAGAGLMGAPGQANYAAANAFEDALAHELHARGRPAVAIDWGAWAEVGMAARLGDTLADRQAAEGIGRIPLAAGLDLMGRLLGHGAAQIAVLPVDWTRFVAAMHKGTPPPLLERLARAAPTSAPARRPAGIDVDAPPPTSGGGADRPMLLARLSGVIRDGWAPVIEGFVRDEAVRILRFPRDKQLDPEQPLLDVGLDSLLAVELKNAIMDGGVDIAVARVMTGPSIRQIGQMVLTVLDDTPPEPTVEVAATAAAVVAHTGGNGGGNGGEAAPARLGVHPIWILVGVILSPIVFIALYVLSLRVVGPEQTAYSSPEQSASAAAPQPEEAAPKSKTPRRKGP